MKNPGNQRIGSTSTRTRRPRHVTYWDEKGNLKRTMTFTDVRDIGGRTVPCRMKLIPADKSDEYTEIVYDDIEYDVEIPDEMFSLQALK